MKKSNILLISLIILFIVLTAVVIFMKISPLRCCACPPNSYKLYPISSALVENSQKIYCDCASEMGCSFSFWVIPIDLVLLIVVLIIILIYNNVKLKSKRKKKK